MRVLVITSNPKTKGALASLTEEAVRGATEAGAEVEQIRLADCNIGYCKFCMTCFKDKDSPIGPCVQKDDMKWILEKLKKADGYVMVSQVSSGHLNARFKTFVERCCYTAGRAGRMLGIEGIPETRFTDKHRFTVTIVSAGSIPSWLRAFCNTATKQMEELSKYTFNSKVIGRQYAGNLTFGGYKKSYGDKAYRLGRHLVEKITKMNVLG